ncbi:hypothetical protein AGMMS49545_11430 [Betaproteobacteria bacterium]|nr:hypothetical protein AGMMS49545_11430 [Betaproteobacteria bacterium]GHU14465.1 hypothetical protein FACS189441_4170 [Betaproteobacteria bacterium]GHU42174.1 hypothetical protein AGMMS50289_06480 [Betaproteobacteria bacterium]
MPSFPRCLAALIYEALLLIGIIAIGVILPYILLGALAHVDVARLARVQQVHFVLLLGLYFIWCWLHGGQTLAMKTWKIRLVDQSGAPLRPVQAVLRYLVAWPCLLLCGVGLLWRFVDPDKQFLHDRIAGTRLVLCAPVSPKSSK